MPELCGDPGREDLERRDPPLRVLVQLLSEPDIVIVLHPSRALNDIGAILNLCHQIL